MRYGSNDTSKLIFEKIKEICYSRKHKLFFELLFGLIPMVAGINIILLYASIKNKNIYMGLASLGILLLLIYFRYVIVRIPVILRKRHEGGFWKRNKDRILVATISSTIGAIIGAIITFIFIKKD